MTDTASERIRVEAPAARCYDVAVDFESYPEWVRDVKEAKILETDEEGRGKRVEFRAAALVDDEALRARMGEAARRRAVEEFAYDRLAAQLEPVARGELSAVGLLDR